MGKTTSITLLLFLILSFTKTTFSAFNCGDYGGDSCSNLEHQEVGDAVYRDLSYEETKLLDQYQHAAIFYGYKDSKLQVLQASGNWNIKWWASHSVHYGDFDGGTYGFINNSAGKTYYGSFSTSGISSNDRNNIILYAEQLEADTDVDYTAINAIDRDTFFISFPLDVNEIDNIRCDGAVEFAYEKSGENVWGYNSNYWNITSSDTNLDKHNDMPDISVEPYTELSPRAQHGGYSNTNTYLVASTPKSPTTSASVTSGLQGSNGWFKSNVQVDIQASDESGIYYIKYKIGYDGSYYDYSAPITMTSTETLFFYAKDNAGNFPRYNDEVTINIDKYKPFVSISLPCGSSCSATSSSTTVGGSVSDTGGSNLDKVYVYNQSNGSSGWDYSVLNGTFSVLGISLNSGSNTIQATAYDLAGNASYVDTIYATYTSPSPPPTPSTPSTPSITQISNGFRISWSNVSGATSYKVYWGTNSSVSETNYSGILTTSSTVYDHTGLDNSLTYYYRLMACNSEGCSGLSGSGLSSGNFPWPLFYAAINAAKNAIPPLPPTPPTPGTVISAGRIWMDRNLGASQVAQSYNDSQAYGDLYQWGRGTDGHEKRTSPVTMFSSTSDTPGHGRFILVENYPYDWRTPQNNNLWQGVSGTNNPCPAGFRLPTAIELDTERQSWSHNSAVGALDSPLKLPATGYRFHDFDWIEFIHSSSAYWSSTMNGPNSICLASYGGPLDGGAYIYGSHRAFGHPVRCIKD